MDISIPTVLKGIAAGASATRSINAWWNRSKGDSRALVGELRDNLRYLDMVAEDGVDLGDVVGSISVAEFKRLSKSNFDFNKLKKARIARHPSLRGTDLEAWGGRETAELVEAIYDRISDLVIRYPHVKDSKKYRWGVRVNNIRKRIWLLLKHVSE